MKRYFGFLFVLSFALLFFASCLSSDDSEVTLYDDTAITSFGISTANIYKHTTSSTGVDSVYSTTNSEMDDYKFHIDQLKGLIYNVDSLPQGTDATKLLCTYSSKNNGMVYLESVNGDSLKYLSTTDSIDFTQPRFLRVYASDMSAYRSYKVMVNVHKEKADSFQWKHIATNSDFTVLTGLKTVTFGNNVYLLGSNGNSTSIYVSTDGTIWNKEDVKFGADAYKNVAVRGNTLFVLDNGTLKSSVDGKLFTDVSNPVGLQRLLGACTTEIYGLSSDNHLMKSIDDGQTWTFDNTDDDITLLPSNDISLCSMASPYAASTDNVVLAGNRSVDDFPTDSKAAVWRKVVEYSDYHKNEEWMYIDFDESNYYPLPRLSGLCVFAYGERLLAIGGVGIGGCTNSAYTDIYESRDNGITWKPNANYKLPDGFDKKASSLTVTVDADNRIWIVCGGTGQVWRGYLNSVVWGGK